MTNERDPNYISVGAWMWMMFVTAIPCLGLLMIFIWAFTGENESRKNYFRAMLVWAGIIVVFFVFLALLGQVPMIQKQLGDALHKR
jgi:hypothetical protein